jgi:hypothetical protein
MTRKPSFGVKREFSHVSVTNDKALNLADDALAIRVDTSDGIPPLSPAFRFCSVTYSRAASQELRRHFGEPGEPKSSSHFESIRNTSLTILFGMDYAT